jgi:hypothetical protein
MTEHDERFFSMDLSAPREHEVDGYHRVGPSDRGWVWDMETTPNFTREFPPLVPVPCPECNKPSEPHHRYEFCPDDWDDRHRNIWAVGVGVFTYMCPEHGEFVNEVIDRRATRGRNGHRVSIS